MKLLAHLPRLCHRAFQKQTLGNASRGTGYGPNRLAQARRASNVQLLLRQFASPVMTLLGAAMLLSIMRKQWPLKSFWSSTR